MEEQLETKSMGQRPLTNPTKPTASGIAYYTPAVKKAIMTYREKNIEKYNEFQRNYYHAKKVDDEWNEKFKERCRIANQKYRDKKRENSPPALRGRPRKTIQLAVGK